MRVLITGVAGFVGLYMARYLVQRGSAVYGAIMKGEDLSPLGEMARGVTAIPMDIRRREEVEETLARSRPEAVIHLAAQSSIQTSLRDPDETWAVNVGGTLNLLEALRRSRSLPRTLLVGSSDVYGQVPPGKLPITEELPLLPITPYGASKACADLLGHQYFAAYDLPVIRIRSFNHTGPGQRCGFVAPDLASQVAEVEAGLHPPTIEVGNLEAKRDLSDVRDVVCAYGLLLERGRLGQAYNVCSGRAVSVRDILHILMEESTVKVEIKVAEERMRPVEVPILWGDHTKLTRDTAWEPQIPLHRTIRDTLEYWRGKAREGIVK